MKKLLLLLFCSGLCITGIGCMSMFMNLEVKQFDPHPNINLASNDRKQSLSLDLDQSIKDNYKQTIGLVTVSMSDFRASLENGFRNGFKEYFRIEPSKSSADLTINITRVDFEGTEQALYITYKATLIKKNGEILRRSAGRATASGGKDVTAVTQRGIEIMYEQIAKELFD